MLCDKFYGNYNTEAKQNRVNEIQEKEEEDNHNSQ